MSYQDVTRAARPPMSPDSGAPGQNTFQRVAAATATEAHNPRPLKQGLLHTLQVGPTAIRISFRGEAGLSTQVDSAASFYLPAGATLHFVPGLKRKEDGTGAVEYGSIYVYGEDDSVAASAWEFFVWPSGL